MEMKEATVEKAIKSYNRYRSPLATANLIEFKGNRFKVRFEGNFCYSCGFDEYFVDLVYELEDEGLKTRLSEFHPENNDRFIAEYEIVGPDDSE
ncbi:hypothetical protein AKJ36_00250 [candidate division MSBL1 archaeon SCGC-AAA259I07]|uniref:NIF system FeS cluster assembly NifU C-terminal domain-containing protein n=2 Tax=candidate division MSBL1 TaxID=215777 RepID=A0A133U918_9EURY|nr:hypothetical protein AKJ61_00030 [candidate division MSBL1 archaeon SCGC-AAA259B11]KXA95538.1 hypothetical protein AKJ36_00250 [candidate division MSBL1 archaeon SCGC-AAA259I07]